MLSLAIKLIIALLAFGVLFSINVYYRKTKGKKDKENDAILKALKKSKGYFSYDRINLFLKQNNGDSFVKNLDAIKFVYIKFILAVVFFAAGIIILNFMFSFWMSLAIGFILFLAGFFMPDLVIASNNKSDNKKMQSDIRRLCSLLKMYTLAGMHITESLPNCYKNVKNERLKRALMEMTAKILSTGQIKEPIEDFRSKFDNSKINMLCIILKQSESSGQSSEFLKNIGTFLDDLEENELKSKETALNSRFIAMMLMTFGLVIGVIVYSLFNSSFLELFI